MKALGTMTLSAASTKPWKFEEVAAATEAMLATIRVQRANHLLTNVAAKADSLSALLQRSITQTPATLKKCEQVKKRRISVVRKSNGMEGGVRGQHYLKRYPQQAMQPKKRRSSLMRGLATWCSQ